MGLVIDTSAVIDLERSPRPIAEVLAPYRGEPLALPAIVVAEVLVGAQLAQGRRRQTALRASVDEILTIAPVVDFDLQIAKQWAELFVVLDRRGTRIPGNDLMVAATAVRLGFGVLVGVLDEAHFRLVRGLRVEALTDIPES